MSSFWEIVAWALAVLMASLSGYLISKIVSLLRIARLDKAAAPARVEHLAFYSAKYRGVSGAFKHLPYGQLSEAWKDVPEFLTEHFQDLTFGGFKIGDLVSSGSIDVFGEA